VAVYYFDTSALVKRYVAETGTPWVQSITDPVNGHDIYVVKIAGPEAISAFVRQAPPLPTLATVLADFTFDFHNEYQQLVISDAVIAGAMRLAEMHRLRGYDAVQLAAALELHAARVAAGLPPLVFVCADLALNAAAALEGLAVDDPNAHP
jgi:predicted nucleic acid-binding protein